MTARPDYKAIVWVPIALLVVVAAQALEGASARSLWQPTAALVVFGGTAAAVLISFPFADIAHTIAAIRAAFHHQQQRVEPLVQHLVAFAQKSRRLGLIALESEADSIRDSFLRSALMLAVDGTNSKTSRQILEIESNSRLDRDEVPADVLETAAGYAPTLGILGAVLGLIHVMEHLSEPAKLGSGIAVAFVATVYGVGSANLLLLPLATRLRGRAREAAVNRDVIIEGVVALQEGLNPRLIEMKLQGFLTSVRASDAKRRVA